MPRFICQSCGASLRVIVTCLQTREYAVDPETGVMIYRAHATTYNNCVDEIICTDCDTSNPLPDAYTDTDVDGIDRIMIDDPDEIDEL